MHELLPLQHSTRIWWSLATGMYRYAEGATAHVARYHNVAK